MIETKEVTVIARLEKQDLDNIYKLFGIPDNAICPILTEYTPINGSYPITRFISLDRSSKYELHYKLDPRNTK
jgi:hypothetical protein